MIAFLSKKNTHLFYYQGRPPILVLSYKNHAIDEFLRDLINAERNVSLIRIGGSCKDQALMQYAEQNQPSYRQVCLPILIYVYLLNNSEYGLPNNETPSLIRYPVKLLIWSYSLSGQNRWVMSIGSC